MLGTACHGPWGTSEGFSSAAVFTISSMIRHATNVAATTQAFAEPLVATTGALVRADAGGFLMTDDTRDNDGFWYRGKVTRRRVLGYGASAGALGAIMSVPAPWQAAF